MEYPYPFPIEYIRIGKITPSDECTYFASIDTPFAWDFVEDDRCERVLISEISEYLSIFHVEIYSAIDAYIKYSRLDFFHES